LICFLNFIFIYLTFIGLRSEANAAFFAKPSPRSERLSLLRTPNKNQVILYFNGKPEWKMEGPSIAKALKLEHLNIQYLLRRLAHLKIKNPLKTLSPLNSYILDVTQNLPEAVKQQLKLEHALRDLNYFSSYSTEFRGLSDTARKKMETLNQFNVIQYLGIYEEPGHIDLGAIFIHIPFLIYFFNQDWFNHISPLFSNLWYLQGAYMWLKCGKTYVALDFEEASDKKKLSLAILSATFPYATALLEKISRLKHVNTIYATNKDIPIRPDLMRKYLSRLQKITQPIED
jgi:hypothetical protein